MHSPFDILAMWKETAGCREGLKQCSACRNSSVQQLELSQNELTAAATKDVGSMLETQARLTYLDMCAAPSPGADVGRASPVPVQMWEGRAQSRRRSTPTLSRSRTISS